MSLKWILQNNLGLSSDTFKLVDYLNELEVHWEHIPIIPFDDSPIEGVDKSGITVFYGSVGMTRRVHATGGWLPGVFFDPPAFAFSSLLQGFGGFLLNSDSEVLSVEEVLKRSYPPKELIFARPTEDDKVFTGNLYYFDEFNDFRERIKNPQDRLKPETLIQLSAPKKIEREMRSFVVNGKVSSSSYYGHGMRNQPVEELDVVFAQRMADLYQPADVFVLDTCRLEDGNQRVVETNCFNASGFYNSDIKKIIQDINQFLISKYS